MSHILDVKGLACPLPVLRAKKAIKPLPPGEVLGLFLRALSFELSVECAVVV